MLSENTSYFWNHPKTTTFFNRWELSVYITSLSLDLMTEQISELLKKNDGKKETTGKVALSIALSIASIQQKMKQEIPFRLDSTSVRIDCHLSSQTHQLAVCLFMHRLPIP